ncbi:CRE-CATP-3 protein, partial [Aphelenchoides avenae]
MLTKKFKRKRSQQQPQPPESARTEILPQDLLREIQMGSPYNEHTMTLEQLVDIYPLSRIDAQNPSKSRGLNDDEALTKLSGGRRNVVRPLTWRSSRIRMFLAQFRNTFRLLLLIAAIVCIIVFLLDNSRTTELAMSIVLITVLFLMCIVSYYEEKKTAKQISGFQNMIPVETTVIRQGRELCVAATDLVIGDLVWIRRGDRIPADLRIIFAEELNLETSWITGEVEPLEYSSEAVPKGIGVFESQDIAFNGCSCTSGQGIGLVIRIGSDTLIGKLVEVTTRDKIRNSRLEVEHVRFVRFITIIALIMATVTFVIGLCINGFTNFVNTLINGFLVVIIANVPQGLPVTLTAQLIIVARRLSKLGLYLKRLDLADTLGMTSVLMTDKTGVLTANDLRVTDLWCQQQFYSTQDLVEKKTMSAESADRRSESGVVQGQRSSQSLRRLAMISDSGSVSDTSSSSGPPIPGMDNSLAVMTTVMCVCDKARIDSSPHQASVLVGSKTPSFRRRRSKNMFYGQKVGDLVPQAKGKQQARFSLSDSAFSLRHKDLKEKSVVGKATDVALIKFVEKFTSAERLRDQYEIVYEVPFSAYRRYHLVITSDRRNRLADDDEVITYTLMVKGAPEELIRNCDTIVTENGAEDLTEDLLVEFEKAYLRFGEEGKSCLAFAMLEFDDFADTEFFWDAEEPNFPDSGWCFLGMAAMYDPPRPHINEAVRKSERAGIRLFMVTGDHPTTAEAVARQIGFCTPCKFP